MDSASVDLTLVFQNYDNHNGLQVCSTFYLSNSFHNFSFATDTLIPNTFLFYIFAVRENYYPHKLQMWHLKRK